jgi:hypothetical protein
MSNLIETQELGSVARSQYVSRPRMTPLERLAYLRELKKVRQCQKVISIKDLLRRIPSVNETDDRRIS